MSAPWYYAKGEEQVASPALLIFRERVERNIERMGVTPPTREQTTAIVTYLQAVGNK